MIKKILMVTIYLAIGYQSMAAVNCTNTRGIASTKGPSKNICMIHTGDLKLKYRGSSFEDAFTKVTDDCFQKRTAKYVKDRKQEPSQDRQILFAESCANSVKCI